MIVLAEPQDDKIAIPIKNADKTLCTDFMLFTFVFDFIASKGGNIADY